MKAGTDCNIFTATFEGPFGGDEDTVDVVVRNATDEEKVAHDLAAVTKAVEDVNTDKMKPGNGAVTATHIEGYVKTRVENALGTLVASNATATNWSDSITVTVVTDIDNDYEPPVTTGGTAKWVGTATITITSGEETDTFELPLTIQVEKQ